MAIDSTEWAWRDMSVSCNGVRVGKFTKFTVETARETEFLYGESDDPFDINPGNKSYTGEYEAYASVIAKMNDTAVAMGYDDLTDVAWVYTVAFKATATSPVKFMTIPNVRFEKFEEGGSNNDKAFKKTLPFKCLKPIRK